LLPVRDSSVARKKASLQGISSNIRGRIVWSTPERTPVREKEERLPRNVLKGTSPDCTVRRYDCAIIQKSVGVRVVAHHTLQSTAEGKRRLRGRSSVRTKHFAAGDLFARPGCRDLRSLDPCSVARLFTDTTRRIALFVSAQME
jgi:hypothetical protein